MSPMRLMPYALLLAAASLYLPGHLTSSAHDAVRHGLSVNAADGGPVVDLPPTSTDGGPIVNDPPTSTDGATTDDNTEFPEPRPRVVIVAPPTTIEHDVFPGPKPDAKVVVMDLGPAPFRPKGV